MSRPADPDVTFSLVRISVLFHKFLQSKGEDRYNHLSVSVVEKFEKRWKYSETEAGVN